MLTLGIVFFTMEILGWNLEHIPGDLGDTRFNIYILEHGYQYLIGHVKSYWNAPFMVPEKSVITYSDNLLGTLPIYAFFRGIGIERFSAFQGWFITITVLNFISAYFFLFFLCKRSYAAALGAFVFAFSLALQSQMTHAQTFPRFTIPMIFLFLVQYLESRKSKYLLFVLLSWSFQVYCGIYLGFLCLIPMAIMLFRGLWIDRSFWRLKIKERKWIISTVIAAVLPLLTILPLLLPYLRRSLSSGYNAKSSIFKNIPTLKSYVYSHYGNPVWKILSENKVQAENWWDFQLFPGAITILSLITLFLFWFQKKYGLKSVKVINWRRMDLMGFTIILLLAICMRFGPLSFYSIIYNLPGFGAIRAVQRIINIELLFFGVAVTYVITYLMIPLKSNLRYLLFLAFAVILCFDNFVPKQHIYRSSKLVALERESQLLKKLSNVQPEATIAYEPDTLTDPYFMYNLDIMLCSQRLGLSCLNAYTGNSPSTFTDYWFEPNAANREKWLSSNSETISNLHIIN